MFPTFICLNELIFRGWEEGGTWREWILCALTEGQQASPQQVSPALQYVSAQQYSSWAMQNGALLGDRAMQHFTSGPVSWFRIDVISLFLRDGWVSTYTLD